MWNARLGKIFRGSIRLLIAVTLAWVVDAKSSSAATIVEILSRQPAFSNFVYLLKSQGLDAKLDGTERFTIFAPTNAAFDNSSSEYPVARRQEVKSLIVSSRWSPQDLAGKRTILKAINGKSIGIDGTDGRLTVGDVEVLSVDVTPSNGIIYVIDALTLEPY